MTRGRGWCGPRRSLRRSGNVVSVASRLLRTLEAQKLARHVRYARPSLRTLPSRAIELPEVGNVLARPGLTRDTMHDMTEVTIRELRNHGGDVVDRVAAGERVVVTRSGKPVAELRPMRSRGLSANQLLGRWRRLPALDPKALQADLDATIDPTL